MNRTIICNLLILLFVYISFGQQYTEGKADETLRGSSRVNPSTLGVEMSIPLNTYLGRGMNLPVTVSYSSKVWRLQYLETDAAVNSPICETLNMPKFAETSAAGWTSSLSFAYIEYTGKSQIYDSRGVAQGDAAPTCGSSPGDGLNGYIRRLTLHLPNGETHELRADDTAVLYNASSNCPNSPCDPNEIDLQANWDRTYYAVDGSNIKYVENSATVTYRVLMPDGSSYDLSPTTSGLNDSIIRKAIKCTDRNGNYITYHDPNAQYPNGYWTDTLGRDIAIPIQTTAPTSPGTQTYPLPGFGGGNLNYTFHWKQLKGATAADSALTDFNQSLDYLGDKYWPSGGTNWQMATPALFHSGEHSTPGGMTEDLAIGGETIFNPIVLTEIDLPDGQSYKFKYNIYGEIERIYYPTGGEESFVYVGYPTLSVQETFHQQANRGASTRKVYETADQGTPSQWSYSVDTISGYKVSITSPDNTRTERFLTRGFSAPICLPDPSVCADGNFGYDNGLAGISYEERFYDSANELLSKKLTTWAKTEYSIVNGYATYLSADWNPRIAQEENVIYDPIAGTALSSTTMTGYASIGSISDPLLPVSVNQYGFTTTTGSLGPLLKTTETDYLSDSNYTTRNLRSLPSETRSKDANGNVIARNQFVYDEAAYFDNNYSTTGWEDPATNIRGNITTVKTWFAETNSWIQTHSMFDNFGNLRKMWDSSGDPDRFVETQYSPTYKYAYPTSVAAKGPDPSGVHGTSDSSTISKVYDFNTGLVTAVTDANGQTATTEYNDPLNRPTRFVPPTGGAVAEVTYYDTPGNLSVKVRQQIDDQTWSEAQSYLDNLGRTVKVRKQDAQGDVFAEVAYDNFGRVSKVSSPYRLGDQTLWSKPRYDNMNRVVETYAPAPDGQTGASLGTIEFGFSSVPGFIGTYVTGTDASGRKARSITNALGELLRLDEPTAGNNLGTIDNPTQPTFYTYDVRGQLTKIQQGQQNRYFMYDSLGRLIRVRQPEQDINASLETTGNPENNQWSAGFTYDVFGNVLTVTDAKGTVITNTYDNAGRAITRSYSDGTPSVDYLYDGKGLPQAPQYSRGSLTKVSSSVSETDYTSFDNQGRLLASQQITDGNTYGFTYKYNLSGALTEETYPSGRVVKNFLASDGGLSAVSSRVANGDFKTYAANFAYSSSGDLRSFMLGNGKWESYSYNNRSQLTQIGLGNSATDTSLWKTVYDYGELNADDTVDATKNTGSIAKQTTTLPGTSFVQTYKYDELNRLVEAKEKTGTTQNWKQTFGYDRFGNRTSFYQIIGSTELPNNPVNMPTVDPNTNRFTTGQGYVYDLNGNLVQDAEGRSFTYNGDDKQTQVKDASQAILGTYSYDGDGLRVKKQSDTETTIFVYDAAGVLAAEYSTQINPNPTTSYLTADQLGSPRVITDKMGNVISRRDSMPFGEDLNAGVGPRSEALKYEGASTDNIRQRFTGYQKDSETDLDFAEARMYQNQHGRFTAVDASLESEIAVDPQSFNRYVYTGNDPINITDPSGLKWCRNTDGGQVNWSDGKCGSGQEVIDSTTGSVYETGCAVGVVTTCYSGGSVIRYNADGTTSLVSGRQLNPAEQKDAAEIARVTGTEVQAQQEEVATTDSATLSDDLASAFMTVMENNGAAQTVNFVAGTDSYHEHTSLGQTIGNVITLTQGAVEIGGGLATTTGSGLLTLVTSPLCITGVGCAVPATTGSISAGGLVVAAHGTGVIGLTIYNMVNNQRAGSRGGSDVQANKKSGDAFRDEVADRLENDGADVEKKVIKNTPFGPRRIDIQVSRGGKVLGGVETKKGPFSRYRPKQRAKDNWLRRHKNYIVNLVQEK